MLGCEAQQEPSTSLFTSNEVQFTNTQCPTQDTFYPGWMDVLSLSNKQT